MLQAAPEHRQVSRRPDGGGRQAAPLHRRRRGDVGPYTAEYLSKVNYNLWIGPAPAKPFNRNRFHYNWHWQWDYGNGDTGNQGPHQFDIARWGLASRNTR